MKNEKYVSKRYTLKNKDKTLVDFTDTTKISNKGDSIYPIKINKIYYENRDFFPIDLPDITGDNLFDWISSRKLPNGRKNATLLLNKFGLDNTAFGYIDLSRGLSLTDTFWVSQYNSRELWENVNLYHHAFNEQIAMLAFTGEGIITPQSALNRSPEFTTNGALPKKWIRRNTKVYLMKGTGIFTNNDDGRSDPFSELYAAQVAAYLKLKHVPYTVERFKHSNSDEEFVSLCPLYTSENRSYIPMVKLLDKFNIDYRLIDTEKEEIKVAKAFGDEKFFSDMIMFDCLIGNTDRHLNNFGIIVDSNTNKFIEPMPIFDNGGAFWCGTYLQYLEKSPEKLWEIEGTSMDVPAQTLYKRFARTDQQKSLESIRNFHFDRNTKYRLSEHTLQVLENNMKVRAEIMLGLLKDKYKETHKVRVNVSKRTKFIAGSLNRD